MKTLSNILDINMKNFLVESIFLNTFQEVVKDNTESTLHCDCCKNRQRELWNGKIKVFELGKEQTLKLFMNQFKVTPLIMEAAEKFINNMLHYFSDPSKNEHTRNILEIFTKHMKLICDELDMYKMPFDKE